MFLLVSVVVHRFENYYSAKSQISSLGLVASSVFPIKVIFYLMVSKFHSKKGISP